MTEISADDLRRRARRLSENPAVIIAARRLEHLHWTPALLVPRADFSLISRRELIDEVDEYLAMSDDETSKRIGAVQFNPERARLTQASMMVNAAELLWRLRDDDPEAWDYVNELYEDD